MITFTVGDFFEAATEVLTGGERLPLSVGNGYCPDLKLTNSHYIECKGIGRSARAIIYADRAMRQHKWCMEQRARLTYYFWKHNARCKGSRSKGALRTKLAKHCTEVLIIPETALADLITAAPWVINKGNPKGYQLGWLIPYKDLRALCQVMQSIKVRVGSNTINKLTILQHE